LDDILLVGYPNLQVGEDVILFLVASVISTPIAIKVTQNKITNLIISLPRKLLQIQKSFINKPFEPKKV